MGAEVMRVLRPAPAFAVKAKLRPYLTLCQYDVPESWIFISSMLLSLSSLFENCSPVHHP